MELNQSNYKRTFTPRTIRLLYLSGFLLIWLLFASLCKGGPNSSDISWYFHVGQNQIADPFILNRYFHVFLQSLFVSLSPNPLVGFQIFWSFLLAVTTVLLFWSASNFTSISNYLNGFLAIVLFLSLPALSHISGIPYVDVTAMTLALALVTLYFYSTKTQHNNKSLLFIIGLFLFFGFKTKETLWPIAIIIIGLASDNNKLASKAIIFKRFLYILFGFMSGVASPGKHLSHGLNQTYTFIGNK